MAILRRSPSTWQSEGSSLMSAKVRADTLASRLTLVQILLHGRKEGAADYKSHIHSAVQG